MKILRHTKHRGGFTITEFILVIAILVVLVALLLPSVQRARFTGRRSHCRNNLRHIGLALDHYRQSYGGYPPAYTVDADGNRLHSWRTLILPFFGDSEYQDLYDQIDLSKPWDDPVHQQVHTAFIPIYQCPSAMMDAWHTTYLAVVTPESYFRPTGSTPWREIADRPEEVLVVIDAPPKYATHWMSPHDADEQTVREPPAQDNKHHTGGAFALFANGRVEFINAGRSDEEIHRSISVRVHDDGPPHDSPAPRD